MMHKRRLNEIRFKKRKKKKRNTLPISTKMSKLYNNQRNIQNQNQKMLGRLIEIASKRPVIITFPHKANLVLESNIKEFQAEINFSSELQE